MKQYFKVNVSKYVPTKNFDVVRPASVSRPKDSAVMFIMKQRAEQAEAFMRCERCLVFWPEEIDVPEEIKKRHAVYVCSNPHGQYCKFYRDENISYLPPVEEFDIVGGAYICRGARIGERTIIMPSAYISGESEIGDDCYIGCGTKLVGEVHIGNRVEIRENTVLGADGLSTDRDEDGRALTMPQFGGVVIEDDVKIGALTVIARGAIDDTIIRKRSKIDNSNFVSHNVVIGEDTFVVGETLMFGSSSTGRGVFISGNTAVRDGRHIGDRAVVGMGSIVTRDIEDGQVVKGNPAR